MKKLILTLLISLSVPAISFAQESESYDAVAEAVAAAKKAPRNRVAQRAAGDALYYAGRYPEAIEFYLKADNSGNLGAAQSAFRLYDFEAARTYLSKYLSKRTAAERDRDIALGVNGIDPTEYLSGKITLGDDMLGRVERIHVIDSINVPADNFFTWMRLAASSGTIVESDVIEQAVPKGFIKKDEYIVTPGYLTEGIDRLLWAKADTTDNVKLYESFRLVDGSWDAPKELFSHSSLFTEDAEGSFVGHPFLMADGLTLYFSADGDRSLGGLDIFMSRSDENGFLQPSNLGMPYNSPFDDYMLVIDEETGAGWWASDRNQLSDSVTIYTFVPSEIRVNYPVDFPGLTDIAKLTDIKLTQDATSDYKSLRRKIAGLTTAHSRKNGRSEAPEFNLTLPDGRKLTRMTDFNSSMARSAMKDYLDALARYNSNQDRLSSLRQAYAKGDRSVSSQILEMENNLENERQHLIELRNQVINSET